MSNESGEAVTSSPESARGRWEGEDTGGGGGEGGFSLSHRPPGTCYFLTTVEPPLSGHLLDGHPLLSSQLSKSQNNCTKEWEIKPLFSGRGHLLTVLTRVLPLLSPAAMKRLMHFTKRIFSSFYEYDAGKYSPR